MISTTSSFYIYIIIILHTSAHSLPGARSAFCIPLGLPALRVSCRLAFVGSILFFCTPCLLSQYTSSHRSFAVAILPGCTELVVCLFFCSVGWLVGWMHRVESVEG